MKDYEYSINYDSVSVSTSPWIETNNIGTALVEGSCLSYINEAIGRLHTVTIKYLPSIKKVIFNKPATIVIWGDNTKTVVKCADGEEYSEEVGLAMCIAEKYCGNYSQFKKVVRKGKTYEADKCR